MCSDLCSRHRAVGASPWLVLLFDLQIGNLSFRESGRIVRFVTAALCLFVWHLSVLVFECTEVMARITMVFFMCVLRINHLCGASTNVGREYFVVFLEHVVGLSNLDIYISTDESKTVNVQISAPLVSSSQFPRNVTVAKHLLSRVHVDKSFSLNFTGRYNNGILISSDGDITVQCFSFSISSSHKNSIGGYLALPARALGLEYMITTFCETNTCIFVVAGTKDKTLVTISIKLPPKISFKLEKKKYKNGDVLNITINRYEVIQITAQGSFSGTLITATQKVAVFVGADYTSARGSSMDHIVEQIPPLNSWGMDYVLIPFPGRSKYSLVVVTAQFEKTCIIYQNVMHVITEAREELILELESGTPATLSSNKRVVVMQISTSFGVHSVMSDPSMLLVPPVDQWVSSYSFVSPTVLSNSNPVVLVLAVNTSCVSEFDLMFGTNYKSLRWSTMAGTTLSTSYTRLRDSGPFSLIPRKQGLVCSSIGGYIYGPGYHSAWAMPIGQSVKKLPDKREVESSSTDTVELSSIHSDPPESIVSSIVSSVIEASDLTSSSVSSVIESSEIMTSSSVSAYMDSTMSLPPNSDMEMTSTPAPTVESSSVQPSFSVLGSLRPPLCSCTCRITRTVMDVSSKIVEMQKNLTVEKKMLSSTKRKFQSAVDPRTSSLTIGVFGIVFISVTLVMITIPDLVQVISYFIHMFKDEDAVGFVK